MSRRSKHQQNRAAAATSGNSTEMTVVDGNATGVAPGGAVADTTSDDAVDAALAAIDAEISEKADVVALAQVEEVEIEQPDPLAAVDTDTDADEIEAILAEAADAEVAGSDMPDDVTAGLAEEAPLTDTETPPAETVEDVVENLGAVSEDDVKEVIEKDADALLAALDAHDNTDPQAVASAASTTKAPRKKKDATQAAPAVPKRDFHSVASIDPATFKTNLDGCNAKKVQEKAQNLIQAIETGKKLSRYTSVAVKRLVADGKVTGKGLVEALQGEGLSLGTARAQAQQMTALFRIAGIAQPDQTAPKELVIADATLANELVKLAA